MPGKYPVETRRKLLNNLCELAESDLRSCCFDLNIKYDNLPTTTLAVPDKAQALIELLNRVDRLEELADWGMHNFPNMDWSLDLPSETDTQQLNETAPQKAESPSPDSTSNGCSGLLVFLGITVLAIVMFLIFSEGTREQLDVASTALVYESRLSFKLAPDVQMDFALIPAGQFIMGSDPRIDRDAKQDEQPQRQVYLSVYYISIHEVTNRQYAVYARETGLNFDLSSGKEDHPVTRVSWNDAQKFIAWLNRRIGWKASLPTEAQWEKACRGGQAWIYPWGNQFDIRKLNSRESGISDTASVGQHSPGGDSPYGLADMSGNVWEWTQDWYSEREYGRSSAGQLKDPSGPTAGKARVLRGGSFKEGRVYARCAARFGYAPDQAFDHYGFRVALNP